MTRASFPEWWSSTALAAMKLTGLPTTYRKVNAKAVREGWREALTLDGRSMCRRAPRGKGYEYRIGVLSQAQQEQLRLKFAAKAADVQSGMTSNAPANVQARLDAFASLSSAKKAKAREKLVAINLFEQYRRSMPVREALEKTGREIGCSKTTIQNWRNLIKPVITQPQYWEAFLAPQHKGKAGVNAECSQDAFEQYQRLYLTLEKRTFAECYHWVKKDEAAPTWKIPSAAAMMSRLKREVPWSVIVLFRDGVDALRRLAPHQTRDRSMFHALEGIQGDGHKIDLWVRFPDGEVTRPMIVMFSDILTNKFLGWHIAKSENTTAVRLAFRQVLVKYGVPNWCLLDNGRAFASKEFTGGQKTRYRNKIKDGELNGVLTSLNVMVRWAQPGHGQSKPIERSFQDICRYVAKDPRFAGAYTGNSPVNKPAYNHDPREKAVDYDLFKAVFEEDIADINAREGRRSPVHNGLSYDQAFEKSYGSVPIRKATEEQIRMVLLKAERVKARKITGEVWLRENRFWSEFLTDHIGELLTLRYDPDNIHAGVAIYDHDNRFLGDAECIEKVGFLSDEDARQKKSDIKRWVKTRKEMLAIENKMAPSEAVKRLPVQAVDDPALEPAAVRLFHPKTRGNAAVATDIEVEDAMPEDEVDRLLNAGLRLIAKDEF